MMKKNIRNRFLAVTAAAASSFLLLSGFDSALTVQDIQNNVRDAMSSMGGFSADVQAVADLSLDMAMGGTVAVPSGDRQCFLHGTVYRRAICDGGQRQCGS